MRSRIRVGTRGSQLARWQTAHVMERIKEHYPAVSLEEVIIRTQGDRVQDVPLHQVGSNGLFVKEIERALIDDEIDLAVHSMKDLPTALGEGLVLGAVLKREPPYDVLVSREGLGLDRLPSGARIGTSSLRRGSQLKHYRPDLVIEPIRGNVETRLRKLEELQLDAVVMAEAGLERMNLGRRITERIPFDTCLPAVGQGSIGVELRGKDRDLLEMLSVLDHAPSREAITAERAFLKQLEGGCQVPIGALAVSEGDGLSLEGMVASTDGARLFRGQMHRDGDPEKLGKELARDLLSRGAGEVLEEVLKAGGDR